MRATLLCVALALCVALVVADPPRPMWPSGFQTFFISTFENHGREEQFQGKMYYDYRQQKERFDVASPTHPGQFDMIIRDYVAKKEYQVLNDQTSCVVKRLNHSMPVFDFSMFEYVGAAAIDGQICDHWRFESSFISVDFYDTDADHTPVRVQSSTAQGGAETTDWWQFVTGPQDPVLFAIDPAWKCTPGAGVAPVRSARPAVRIHPPVRKA